MTYTALANDANGNPVQGEKVTWETDINTLSASESVTDASGKASITVKGPTRGRATIKATLNGTMLTDSSVTFTDVVLYDWDITGTTAKYSGTVIVDYPAVGFLATGEVKGPTSLIWLGNASKTALTVPMKNDAGETVNVIFQGQRNRADCSTVQFEAAQSCKTQKNLPELVYNASDNPSLPAGHYAGHITFNGIEWHNGSPLLAYDITTSLTVK